MLDTQREALFSRESDYLSVGITETGAKVSAISVPWEDTAHAFNMKIPDVYITPQDLRDQEIWERIGSFTVVGCYIFTPLPDYSFLAKWPSLRDISIRHGKAIRDLSFMESIKNWSMLYIEDAVLPDLLPLYQGGRDKGLFSTCLGFYHCKIANIIGIPPWSESCLSELLIWPKEPSAEEMTAWGKCGALKFRYYINKQAQ
ncbi:MAG: hypothetical protein LUE21_03610 [Oscillospiraceae bacterium]|nr:hypothetical protein [Oscillospiraceae bacterium]